MKIKYLFIFIFSLLFIIPLKSKIFWDGRFYEHTFFLLHNIDKKINTTFFGTTILDIKLDSYISEIVRIRSELEYTILFPEKKSFLREKSSTFNLNTANASIMPSNFKFTIGKFLPKWGKGKIFRPMDIFTPQTFFLNKLSYKGIDGFSSKYYISDLSSFELLFIPSMDIRNISPFIDYTTFTNSINHSIVAGNLEFHLFTFDNNLIFLRDTSAGNTLIGAVFKGDIIVGLWGEISFSFKNEKKILKISSGMDYSFAKYFFTTIEYFYDESGVKNYKQYPKLMTLMPRMTYGREYTMLDFYILTPEGINFGIASIINLIDKSFIIFPYYRNEILQNTYLGISLYYFNGKNEREFAPEKIGNIIINTYLFIRF